MESVYLAGLKLALLFFRSPGHIDKRYPSKKIFYFDRAVCDLCRSTTFKVSWPKTKCMNLMRSVNSDTYCVEL